MELSEVRKEIDQVDQGIKDLFEKRMLLADEVAKVKAETEDDIFKPDREKEIIQRLTKDVDPSIQREYTALIRRIMEVSRKYQYGRTLELRNCLHLPMERKTLETEQESFTRVAVLKSEQSLFQGNHAGSLLPVDSYEEMVNLIRKGTCTAGAGMIENIGFGVSDNLHTVLADNHFYIHHCEIVKDQQYRKKVVTFSPHFFVGEEDNRMKILFVCGNHSGSLASVLSMIADYGINLTEIHSRPDQNRNWNYYFLAELAANPLKQETKALIYQLMNETERFQILGSYWCEE